MHRLAHVKAAGQVAQDLNAAGFGQCRIHARGHLLAIQQIGLDHHRIAQRAGVGLQGLGIAVQQQQARAPLRKMRGDGRAQLAGGAGDQDNGVGGFPTGSLPRLAA